jgi:hypothetical protein
VAAATRLQMSRVILVLSEPAASVPASTGWAGRPVEIETGRRSPSILVGRRAMAEQPRPCWTAEPPAGSRCSPPRRRPAPRRRPGRGGLDARRRDVVAELAVEVAGLDAFPCSPSSARSPGSTCSSISTRPAPRRRGGGGRRGGRWLSTARRGGQQSDVSTALTR